MSNSLISQTGDSPFIYTQGAGLVNGIQLWWGSNNANVSCFTLTCETLNYSKQFSGTTQTTIVSVPNSVDYFFSITSTDSLGVTSSAAHFNKLSAGFAPDCISHPNVQVFSSFNATVSWRVTHLSTQQVIAAYLVTAVKTNASTAPGPSFTVHPWCSTLNFRGYSGSYKFIIQAIGSGSAYSSDLVMTDVYSMGVPPLPIINVVLVEQNATTFSISWMGAGTATSYIFTVLPDNGAPSFTIIPAFFDGHTPAYFTSCDLWPEYYNSPNYYLTITAVNDGGTTDSEPTMVRFGQQVPYNVAYSSITSSSFTLTWQGAEDTAIFKFSLDSGSTLTYTSWYPFPYGVSTSGHATFRNLPLGATYSGVIIYACNYNSTIVVRSLPPYSSLVLLPGAITRISASLITQSTFTISWTGGQGANTFEFGLQPTVLSAFSATYRGLEAGTYYSTSITPINRTGAGVPSTIRVRTVVGPITGLSQGVGAYKTLLITWNGAFGADYYRYYVNAVTGLVGNSLSSVTVSGLNANTTYSVSIVSFNSLWGTLVGSTVSQYVNLTTGPVLPLISLTKLNPSTFRVSWTPVSNLVYTLSGSLDYQNNVISPLTISSLAVPSTYMLALAATNGFGSSVSSFRIIT
jgi:hypothetical protein